MLFENKYVLISSEIRKNINVTNEEMVIEDAIASVLDNEFILEVTEDGYTYITEEAVTRGEKLKIGRIISKHENFKNHVKHYYKNDKKVSGQLFKNIKNNTTIQNG